MRQLSGQRNHTHVPKTWGHEVWFENNEKYCGKVLTCYDKDWSSDGKFHYHEFKDETFFVIEGELLLQIRNITYPQNPIESIRLTEGMSYRLKPMTQHRFRSVGQKCVFIEVSTHHNDTDTHYVSDLG